ncbi:MAG: SRPBCC family protein [Chthoniobacterales bacterium]
MSQKTFEMVDSVPTSAAHAKQESASVVTCQDFPAPAEAVWDALMFYEEVAKCPPFFLRWILPIPLATEGCKFEVGSEVKCRYVGGHLLKRVTAIVGARSYAFDIVEQNLALGGIKLLGGEYRLRDLPRGRTRVALATRYASPNQPRWLCGRFEAVVCHSFHRHILTAMRSNLAPRDHSRTKR